MIVMQQKDLPRDEDHDDIADMLINKLCSRCFTHSVSKQSFDCKDDRVEGQQHKNRKHHDQNNVEISSDKALVRIYSDR